MWDERDWEDFDELPTGLANLAWADPGEISGWAVICVAPDALEVPEMRILENVHHWSCGEVVGPFSVQCESLLVLYGVWPDAAVGTEDFILNTFRRDRTLLVPVEINAVLRYELGERMLFRQMAGDAKRTMPDNALHEIGFYERTIMPSGEDHARDAVRHVLTFLRRAKSSRRLRRTAWPHLFE